MNNRNNSVILQKYGVMLLDILSIFLAYIAATKLRYIQNHDWGIRELHYTVMAVFVVFCVFIDLLSDQNRDYGKRGSFRELIETVKTMLGVEILSLVALFFLHLAANISRIVIIYFSVFIFVFMLALRLLYKKLLLRYFRTQLDISKMLIVAEPEQLERTLRHLKGRQDLEIAGIVCCHRQGSSTKSPETAGLSEASIKTALPAGVSVTDYYQGSGRSLTSLLIQTPFDEVLLNLPSMNKDYTCELVEGFEKMGVVCHDCPSLPSLEGVHATAGTLAGLPVITYSRVQTSHSLLWVKRLIDILGGLVGLLLTGILCIFLVPAIKLDSPGPVFFSQERIGKNGRRFKIYKFRSMYKDAEARKKELEAQNQMSGLMFKMDNDPRITKVGAFIRKTSLDEFPQFLNVLKGDMSLVGTRPPTAGEFEQYNEHYRRRLSMTPGLTGMWQVSGRSAITDFDEIVRLDLEYIDNWSLMLDFKILLQTVLVVLFGKGAK